jgi:hypothetical protein
MTRGTQETLRWPAILAVLALACFIARAENGNKNKSADTNSIPLITGYIEKFEIPERDGKGNLRTIFKGDRATFLPDGQMDMVNLRAEFYSSNQLSMAFSAAKCRVDQHNKRGSTDDAFQLEREDLTVTGIGADWNDASKIINVHSNVRVIFTGGVFVPATTKKTP